MLTLRSIRSGEIDGVSFLGALRFGDQTLVGFSSGSRGDRRLEEMVTRSQVMGTCVLGWISRELEREARPDNEILAGLNVLFAVRNGETTEATADWLRYHAAEFQADGALILDRSRDPTEFFNGLQSLDIEFPVVVVGCDQPLGPSDGKDLRHPEAALSGKNADVPVSAWHSAVSEFTIFELLRHQFLAKTRAVASLSIADMMLPSPKVAPFENAVSEAGKFLAMRGIATYPWRLRQDAPARHLDHIAVGPAQRGGYPSWCADLKQLPDDALLFADRIANVQIASSYPVAFRRAMGVIFPGVPVNRLVNKTGLREDPALVKLMTRAFDKKPIRVPKRNTTPPARHGRRVAIVSTMKNEGPFIVDWVAHNKAIGVDHMLVYTNDCADGTDHLLDLLAPAGVTRRDNPYATERLVPQYAAFKAAVSEPIVEETDWLLTLDVDEYINVRTGAGRLDDLFDALPEAHAISMPWRLFGNADLDEFEDRPVTEQFSLCAAEYTPEPYHAWAFKTLYQNAGLFRRLGVHRPKGINSEFIEKLNWVTGAGTKVPNATWKYEWRVNQHTWGYDLVQLNHYAVRSADSFLVKRDRGRVNHTEREQGLNYWFRMNHNLVEDLSIQRMNPLVAKEKAAILALPGVKGAHQQTVEWHIEKSRQLQEEIEHKQFYDLITSPRMKKLSRLHGHFGGNVYEQGSETIPDHVIERQPSDTFFFNVEKGG